MNTNSKIIITAISTLAVGLLLGWLFFSDSESESEAEHEHTAEVDGSTVWTCSMHPQIRQNEPGDCPICGMDLIPLSEGQDDIDPMAISMSPTAMQLANVATDLVGAMDPVKIVRLNGKVQTDERLVFSQSSHIPGRVEKLTVNFTGEYVKAGQPVAYIYSPDLVTAQEELFEAYKIRETQPQLYKAAREKLKNWKLTESQLDRIITSGNAREEFPVLADVSGYVTKKMVNLGDYIQRGEAIYEIASLSKVWVLFDVYESDIPWISKGDEVVFTVASLPGEEFSGEISFIDPVIDPRTRVAQARVEVNNPGLKLKPEMFASGIVKAELPLKSKAVVIPKSAVMWTGQRSVVYIKSLAESGISFTMREVKLGPALGESYVIESGLEEGEEIAVHGTFSIDAAAQLAGKPSMMNPEGGPSMTGHNHGDGTQVTAPAQSDPVKVVTVSESAKEALKPLINDYLQLKDALVNDNLEEARQAVEKFQTDLSKINMSLFTGESHNVWMKYSDNLKKATEHLSHAKDIEETRKGFHLLSDTMIGLVEAFRPVEGNIYVQHCPMADSNKGADWLSLSKEIRNPYFGEAMLTCGEVTQEIK